MSGATKQPKVLVTGATGFIGLEVSRQLSELGLRPRLMVRRIPRGVLVSSLDAEFMVGDLESEASLERVAAGVDVVIHLGGRATFEAYELLKGPNVDGSVALMRQAARAGARHFVFSSSLLVYDGRQGVVDQDTPANPLSGYGRSKLEAEVALRELASRLGVGLAVFRLPHTYGALDLLFEQVRRGRVYSPGRGHNRFGRMHVKDAASLLIRAGLAGWSGVSPVADDLSATWNRFYEVLGRFYPSLNEWRVPEPLALAGTRLLGVYQRLRGGQGLYTPDGVVGWNLDIPVKPGLVWGELGIRPCFPTIEEGIPQVLDEVVAFRWVHPVYDRC